MTLNLFTWAVLAHNKVHRLKSNLGERRPEVRSMVEDDVVNIDKVCVDCWDSIVKLCEAWIEKELKSKG